MESFELRLANRLIFLNLIIGDPERRARSLRQLEALGATLVPIGEATWLLIAPIYGADVSNHVDYEPDTGDSCFAVDIAGAAVSGAALPAVEKALAAQGFPTRPKELPVNLHNGGLYRQTSGRSYVPGLLLKSGVHAGRKGFTDQYDM